MTRKGKERHRKKKKRKRATKLKISNLFRNNKYAASGRNFSDKIFSPKLLD